MKNTTMLMLLLLVCTVTMAQSKLLSPRVLLGYYGQVLVQPGVKLGVQANIKEWETESTQLKSLFVNPQLGYFARLGYSRNYVLNLAMGYQTQKQDRKLYSAVSLGMGYLLQNDQLSFGVNLGSGEYNNRNWESSHFFMPTLSYEFGGQISPVISWYSQYSAGFKFSSQKERAMVAFVELGVKLKIKSEK